MPYPKCLIFGRPGLPGTRGISQGNQMMTDALQAHDLDAREQCFLLLRKLAEKKLKRELTFLAGVFLKSNSSFLSQMGETKDFG